MTLMSAPLEHTLLTRDNCMSYARRYMMCSLLTVYRFDENYGLASTQSLKNKDIPEGGAKGTILPSYVAYYSIFVWR
jgi:hypothetical protein